MTEQLDKEWKEMRFLISSAIRTNKPTGAKYEEKDEADDTKEKNDYDVLVKTLQFDLKAQASDKLKTPEQIEKERLKALKDAEDDLLRRMNEANTNGKDDSAIESFIIIIVQ